MYEQFWSLDGTFLDGKRPFLTAYRRPAHSWAEHSSGKTITEMAYVPPQAQIADMMDAGRRLAAERRLRFDNRELNLADGEDVPMDPTRQPGLDLVDLQRARQGVNRRLAAQRAALQAKKKEREDEIQKRRVQPGEDQASASSEAGSSDDEQGKAPEPKVLR